MCQRKGAPIRSGSANGCSGGGEAEMGGRSHEGSFLGVRSGRGISTMRTVVSSSEDSGLSSLSMAGRVRRSC